MDHSQLTPIWDHCFIPWSYHFLSVFRSKIFLTSLRCLIILLSLVILHTSDLFILFYSRIISTCIRYFKNLSFLDLLSLKYFGIIATCLWYLIILWSCDLFVFHSTLIASFLRYMIIISFNTLWLFIQRLILGSFSPAFDIRLLFHSLNLWSSLSVSFIEPTTSAFYIRSFFQSIWYDHSISVSF